MVIATPRRGPGRGFTLPELLVVITILVILAAMLAPALNDFVERAHTLQCQSNLKQIATALLNYSAANEGIIMPCRVNRTRDNHDTRPDRPYWSSLLVQYEYIDAPNTAALGDALSSTGSSNVFQCPSGIDVRGGWHWGENPAVEGVQKFVRQGGIDLKVDNWYYYNAWTWAGDFPAWGYPPDGQNMPGTRQGRLNKHTYLGMIKDRATMAMVCDGVGMNGHWKSNGSRVAARHWGDVGDWDGVTTHRTITNIAYYDGHVEAYQWARDYRADPLWGQGLHMDHKPYFHRNDQ